MQRDFSDSLLFFGCLLFIQEPRTKAGYSAQITCFWDDTTSVEGSSNLSILHNVAFEGARTMT